MFSPVSPELLFWAILVLGIAVLTRMLPVIRQLTRKSGRPTVNGEHLPEVPIDFSKFERQRSLLTDAELVFMKSLQACVGNQLHIAPKVRLEDIVAVGMHQSWKERNQLRSRIKSRHIDFVLCDPDDFSVAACLELDDASHRQPKRQERDRFIEELLERTGIPLIRIPARYRYNEETFRNIQSLLDKRESRVFHQEDPRTHCGVDSIHRQPRIIVFEEADLNAALLNAQRGGRSLYLHRKVDENSPDHLTEEVQAGRSIGCLIDQSYNRLFAVADFVNLDSNTHLSTEVVEAPYLTLFGSSLQRVLSIARRQEELAFSSPS